MGRTPLDVLILGGTGEASALAAALAGDARFAATLSLAGRTRAPAVPPIPCRVGGFGGADGLARHLRESGTRALIDATHPFAARISANALAAARQAGVPALAIRRPEWTAAAGDRWTLVADMAAAAAALGMAARRVFLTVGRQDLAPFRAAPWHRYVIRSVDPPAPEALPPDAVAIAARGPFDAGAERDLLRAHRIEVVVTKNSGGEATRGKLIAARDLGLPAVLVRRPPPAAMACVADAAGALAWLVAHHAGAAARGA